PAAKENPNAISSQRTEKSRRTYSQTIDQNLHGFPARPGLLLGSFLSDAMVTSLLAPARSVRRSSPAFAFSLNAKCEKNASPRSGGALVAERRRTTHSTSSTTNRP